MHLNTLSLSPIVPFHVYVLFQCPISGGSWLSVTESFIPFHILSHPSSPLHSNRPRWSKCLTFVARMYPRVLVYWFAVFNAGALPFTPSNSSLSAVDPRFYIYALTILLPFDCAFHHRFLHSHFQDVVQVRSSYPELTLRKNEIYTFWSQISHACKCPHWLNKNEGWVF